MATLVAHGVSYEELFAAVGHEVAELVHADATAILRFEPDDTVTLVAAWNAAGVPAPVGERQALDATLRRVRETGCPLHWRPANGPPAGPFGAAARRLGLCAAVGVAIEVDRRVWGVSIAAWQRLIPLTDDIETRMAEFAELVGTAIANAEAWAEIIASRARIAATADETRRRIERDLHDGAQQQLVSLALQLRAAQGAVPPDRQDLGLVLDQVIGGLTGTLDDLREYARGLHPAILAEGGLVAALKTLARRSSVPVELELPGAARLPEPIEVTAYYVVCEALANAAKHANASVVRVCVQFEDRRVRVAVRDDGVGGADPAHGSGLVGLKDRVAAVGGHLTVHSRLGEGTELLADLPVDASVPDPNR